MAPKRDVLATVKALQDIDADRKLRRQADKLSRRLSPQVLAQYANYQPDIPPNIVAVLALNNITADSNTANTAARLSRKARDNYVKTIRAFRDSGDFDISESTRDRIRSAIDTDDTAELGRIARQFTRLHEATDTQLGGGIFGAAGKALNIASQPSPVERADIPGVNDALRAATTAMNTPLEFLQGNVRASLQDNPFFGGEGKQLTPGGNVEVARRSAEQTMAYQNIVKGKSLGDGILPSYDSSAAVAAAEAARQYSPHLIGGHAFTLGRQVADWFFEPDSIPFDGVSGFFDATVAMRADPANFALDLYGKTRATNRVFAGADEIADLETRNERALAGLFQMPRKKINGVMLDDWIAKDFHARLLANKIAQSTSFTDLLHIANGDPSLALRYLDATTPDAVVETMREYIRNGQLREMPRAPSVGYKARRRLEQNWNFVGRLASDIPNAMKRLDDPRQFVATWMDELRSMRIPDAEVNRLGEQAARYVTMADGSGPATGLMDVMTEGWALGAQRIVELAHVPEDVAGRALTLTRGVPATEATDAIRPLAREGVEATLKAEGVKGHLASRAADMAEQATKLTRAYAEETMKVRKWMTDEMKEAMDPMWVKVDGNDVPLDSPVRFIDFLSSNIPMVNSRGVKESTGLLRNVYRIEREAGTVKRSLVYAAGGATLGAGLGGLDDPDNPWAYLEGAAKGGLVGATGGTAGVHGSMRFLDAAMSNVFKPAVLATRIAWPLRVMGEESARMSSADLSNLFRHPISYLTWVVGRSQTPMVADIAAAAREAGYGDEFVRAMTKGAANLVDAPQKSRNAAVFAEKTVYTRTNNPNEHLAAWRETILRDRTDPIIRAVARRSEDDFIRWATEDEVGQNVFRKLRADGDVNEWFERVGDDAYRTLYNEWRTYLNKLTGGDPEILDLFVAGTVNGNPIVSRSGKLTDEYKALLARKHNIGPEEVIGDRVVPTWSKAGFSEKWNHGVSSLFNGLMAVPDNKLIRSPAFRQLQWQSLVHQMPHLTPDAQQTVLRAARGEIVMEAVAKNETVGGWTFRHAPNPLQGKLAKLPNSVISQLELAARSGSGEITALQATLISKAFSLDQVEWLLYDLSKRNQGLDSLRLMFPFGEAFKEVVSRWVGPDGLLARNPRILRRLQQGIQGARQSGFFYHDDQFDKEVFAIPGSSKLSELVGAGPQEFLADPSSLNLAGSGYPGFSPGAQILAEVTLGSKPGWRDEIMKIVAPYGTPLQGDDDARGTDLISTLVDAFAPGGARQFNALINGPNSDYEWNRTVMQIRRYKMSTGGYGSSAGEQRRLLKDSESAAKGFLALRGLPFLGLSFSMPASGTPQWRVKDKDGKLHVAVKLSDELRELEDEDPNTAIHKMIRQYGESTIHYLLSGTTRSPIGGLPPTDEANLWVRSHAQVKAKAPNAYGWLAPQGDEFSIDAYSKQLKNGERVQLTPDQQEQLANDRLARGKLDYFRSKFPPELLSKAPVQAAIRTKREQLIDEYPGAFDPMGIPSKATTDQQIDELRRVIDLPSLQGNQAARGIRRYLDVRDQLEEAAVSNLGLSKDGWYTAKKAAPLVAALVVMQDRIRRQYPDARQAMDYLFDGDVRNYGSE